MPDIFDKLLEKKKEGDIFTILKESKDFERIKKEFDDLSSKKKERELLQANRKLKEDLSGLIKEESQASQSKLTEELVSLVKREMQKIKPSERIIERIIQKEVSAPIVVPPKIVEKVIEKKQDLSNFVEKSIIEELRKEIADLKKQLTERQPDIRVVGEMLPNHTGITGNLYSDGHSLKWTPASSSSAGGSPEVYSANNVTTRRSFDADDTSLDELADLVGSLIIDMQAVGLLQ
jgi:hypothetical protein